MITDERTVIVIAGPTAVGKTAAAIQVAQHFHTAIISADSRQCYKEMSIGTAKPSPEELKAVKHYFIDEFPVTEHITAAGYERLALGYLEEIFAQNKIAVVCGGTGLYIKALCRGLDEMPETDAEIGKQVNEAYLKNGIKWLQKEIQYEDPLFFDQSEKDNPSRLLRALVFKRSTGKSILQYRTGTAKPRDFRIVKIILELPRRLLYNRINQRVDNMIQEGLLEEVKALYPYRYLKNLQTVGYTELFGYLDGHYSLTDAAEKIKQHTRNYAKRQMTWFRREKDAVHLTASASGILDDILKLCQ